MSRKLVLVGILATGVCGCGPSKTEVEAHVRVEYLQKEVNKSGAEIDRLRKDLADVQSSSATNAASAQKTIAELKDELAKLAEELRAARGELTASNKTITDLRTEKTKNAPSPEYLVAGEVFIVTSGAQNYRLGRVEIQVFDAATLSVVIGEKRSQRPAALEKLRPALERAEAEYESVQGEYVRLSARALNFPNLQPKPSSDPMNHARDAFHALLEEKRKILSNSFIFDSFPKPIKSVRTNSDGKFELSIDRNSDLVMAARAIRNNGSAEEEYYWVLPIIRPAGDKTEFTLSNDNLLR